MSGSEVEVRFGSLTQNEPAEFHRHEENEANVVAVGRASAVRAVLQRGRHVDDDCEQDEEQEATESELPVGHERLAGTFANENGTDYDKGHRYEESKQVA